MSAAAQRGIVDALMRERWAQAAADRIAIDAGSTRAQSGRAKLASARRGLALEGLFVAVRRVMRTGGSRA